MTNKPKVIGTQAETRVVNYLKRSGFPHAERRALAGQQDKGDILVTRGLIAEVKAGAMAEDASDERLRGWCAETERERINAEADHAFLVVKRKGHGVHKIGGWHVVTNDMGMLVKYRLDEYVALMVKLYGGR